jgi:hypothetical protein
MFHLPFSPQRKPTEPLGTVIHRCFRRGEGFPFRIVGFTQAAKIGGAQKRSGTKRPSARFSRRTSIGMSLYWRQ